MEIVTVVNPGPYQIHQILQLSNLKLINQNDNEKNEIIIIALNM